MMLGFDKHAFMCPTLHNPGYLLFYLLLLINLLLRQPDSSQT